MSGAVRRTVREAPPDPAARATYAFRLCVARAPAPAERETLVAAFLRERDHFATERRAGREMLGGVGARTPEAEVPELAAWTVVASALLNLDETLTKE